MEKNGNYYLGFRVKKCLKDASNRILSPKQYSLIGLWALVIAKWYIPIFPRTSKKSLFSIQV